MFWLSSGASSSSRPSRLFSGDSRVTAYTAHTARMSWFWLEVVKFEASFGLRAEGDISGLLEPLELFLLADYKRPRMPTPTKRRSLFGTLGLRLKVSYYCP
jgi:hypothetical protein